MKRFIPLSIAILLSGCSTVGSDCRTSNDLSNDFGSMEISQLHKQALQASLYNNPNKTIELADEGLTKSDLNAYGESALHKIRAQALMQLKRNIEAADGFAKVVFLNQVSVNESKFLEERIEMLRTQTYTPEAYGVKPVIRVPPKIPSRAFKKGKSGFCQIRFDVTAVGTTENVNADFCTDDIFRLNSIEAVKLWKFSPQSTDGVAVTKTNVVNKVTYRILDSCGNLYPE